LPGRVAGVLVFGTLTVGVAGVVAVGIFGGVGVARFGVETVGAATVGVFGAVGVEGGRVETAGVRGSAGVPGVAGIGGVLAVSLGVVTCASAPAPDSGIPELFDAPEVAPDDCVLPPAPSV
jgi:hypothetical protein